MIYSCFNNLIIFYEKLYYEIIIYNVRNIY